MNNIFFMNQYKNAPCLRHSVLIAPLFAGLKSGVTKWFGPTALQYRHQVHIVKMRSIGASCNNGF